ncbi:hypothetical protein COW36_23760 [bacterium (Candidatus Blackallbacteria) CG17_big_fil_post_rev_8_21_14_2_50_48_46]|uniref:Urease accessory protein UreD n=1 Tax=bacterium (Candidatus Blackallbacteria) CG17_big_fil_post_rev_8_21_14_2_50_48_46 TaxID=2014261 RepID=A0A2M7FXP8_9BACT|nr:MAG: hypothetical protein COW64_17970 [bacterium (Candidatus Blackallbacteria) CG18_big_fil_WC_8_21_14_2_50_49_26]PIW14054.1 MAG: hypothetical protein COW36_23760 [bacterium (Candidatus Blackallbacteria) CG17_big_fil_post_rev_8_21_14_2_50_48_46]PIW50726.1 MAG: hypothetical protein COW20_01465 [bacterium (Candidatus Blackallbacteria) CG13_big_fil_rev_8_21_14_2_50_49_14]
MHSQLQLQFRQCQGQTQLKTAFCSGALKVFRPFQIGPYALLQISSNAPGIHNGDRIEIEIEVEAGAQVILLHQSATKLHPKQAPEARQNIQIQIGPAAHLEYYPGLCLPFEGAHFSQTIEVSLAPQAQFGFFEAWSAGRLERGEAWRFKQLSSLLRINQQELPLYRDAFEITENSTLAGLTDGYPLWAHGFWHGLPNPPAAMQTPPGEATLAGWGPTPKGSHYYRALSRNSLAFQKTNRAYLEQRWKQSANLSIPWQRYASGLGF